MFEATYWDRIRSAIERDPRAQAEIFERYRPPVLHYVRKNGFDEHAAEDVASEVFARLLSPAVLSRADAEKGRFRTYVLAIARNVMSEERKRRHAAKRDPGLPIRSLDEPVSTQRDTSLHETVSSRQEEQTFLESWSRHLLGLAIDRLALAESELLRLRYRDGLTQAETAERMRKPLGTIKTMSTKALASLKQKVKELIYEYSSSRQEYQTEIALLAKYL